VTELVTGLDLVEEMLKIAAGKKLKLKQKDVKLEGSAIETRVYAEDPARSFLPSTGRLIRYRPPREGTTVDGITVRLDSGVEEGGEIPVYYDPMIAKLITHAPTRGEAIEAMGNALDAFAIDGFRHNIPFLSVLMRNPRWREGRLSTKFIGEEFPGGFKPPLPDGSERDAIVAIAATIDHMSNQRRRAITQQMHGEPVKFAEVRIVELAGAAERVTVAGGVGGPFTVIFEGGQQAISLASNWWFGEPVWKGTIDGKPVSVQIRPILNGYEITYEGVEVQTRVLTEREAELAALMPVKEKADTSKLLLCPMPGMVVSLAVGEGQDVRAGDALCVVEAMKMENVLKAERDGKVAKVLAKPGDSLNVDAVILEFA
jgi:propionyl-CoA carboxylase alpha chain